jgi:DNA replication initiation complex subunit (GINS family)
MQGQTAKVDAEVSHKRMTLRFTKSIPAIIGLDMKTYGPFMVEDVASLPVENAKILVKQGLAVLVEVS